MKFLGVRKGRRLWLWWVAGSRGVLVTHRGGLGEENDAEFGDL